MKSLVTVSIKDGIIYMNLPFIYINLIILSLLKVVTLKLTMYFLTILTYPLKIVLHWKIDFL